MIYQCECGYKVKIEAISDAKYGIKGLKDFLPDNYCPDINCHWCNKKMKKD